MANDQTDDYSSIILKKTSPILNLISVVLGSQDLYVTNKKKTKKSKKEKDDRVLVMLRAGLNMMAVKISNLNTSFGFIKTISDLFIRSEDLVVAGAQGRTPLAIEQLEGTSPSDVFGSNLSFGPSNIFEKFVDNFAIRDVGLIDTGVIGSGIEKSKIASTYEFEQSVNFLTESSDISIKENLNLSFETNPSIQFIEKPDKFRKLSFEATESVIIQRQELLLKVLESNQILDDILCDQESIVADSFYTELPEQKFEYFDRIPGNPSNDESSDESNENEIKTTNYITLKRKRRKKTFFGSDILEELGYVGCSVFIPGDTTHINQSDSEPHIKDSKTTKDDPNIDAKDVLNQKEHPTMIIEDHSTITEISNVQVEQMNSQVPYPIIQIDDLSSQADEASNTDIPESNATKEDPYSKIEDICTQIEDLDKEIEGLYTEITDPINLIVDPSTEPLDGKSQQEDLQIHLEEQTVLTHDPSDQIDENEATKQPTITTSVPNIVKDLMSEMRNKNITKTEKEDANTQDIKVDIPRTDIGIQKVTSQMKDLYTRRKAAFLLQEKNNSQDQDIRPEANKGIVECKSKEILPSKSKDNNNMEPLQNQFENDYEVGIETSKKSRKTTSIGSKILEVVLEKDAGHQQNIVGTFIISQNLKMGDKIKEAKIVRMLREQFNYTTMLRLDEDIKIQVDSTKLLTFYKIQLNTH